MKSPENTILQYQDPAQPQWQHRVEHITATQGRRGMYRRLWYSYFTARAPRRRLAA